MYGIRFVNFDNGKHLRNPLYVHSLLRFSNHCIFQGIYKYWRRVKTMTISGKDAIRFLKTLKANETRKAYNIPTPRLANAVKLIGTLYNEKNN